MATVYPGAIDNLTNPTAANDLDTAGVVHDQQHANANDAIEAVETELGLNPKGAAASVRARLDAMDTLFAGKVGTGLLNAASGVATLDSSSKLVQFLDAAKVSSGTFATARIPLLASSKIDPASGAFPTALIPSLGAAQITSGVFSTARIPGLPGSWITSGTIDAARLPSSVTANANARVVADLAGRDAILVAERVDGMLVIQRDKMIIWTYRADNTSWVRMPNVQRAYLSAVVTALVNQVWTPVPALAFDVLAGERYAIDLTAYASCPSSSTVDIRYGWSWTGTGTMTAAQDGVDINTNSPNYNGTVSGHAVLAQAASPLNEATGLGTPSGIPVLHRVAAFFDCTANGTVTPRILQDTTNATITSRLEVGTNIRAERIV